MKKSLLALAVLGAFAAGTVQAQTNVSIGGVIRANIKSYKISSTARQTSNELRIDDDFNSRFWLTGTEDLGGGLKALFYVENRFNTDVGTAQGATGNGLGNGDTFVGLRGDFGQVTLGKHTWMSTQGLTTELITGTGTVASIPTSMLATFNVFDQTGAGYLDTTRRLNSITYRTPNISGFSGTVGIAAAGGLSNEGVVTAGNPNYNDGKEYFLQGAYANGPLYLNLAYWDAEVEGGTGADVQQLRFSGSYKFAGFKVGLGVDRAEVQPVAAGANFGGKISRTAWSIPLSYAIGNGTVMASFTKAGDRTGVTDSGAKMYTVGYDQALSKRTNVGVFYSRLDNDRNGAYQPFLAGTTFTGTAPVAGETASTFGVGIHHTF
ncbi:porin [Noviherbaspirillum sedimenti]|nr:porin [Noviherbaspirillum sedimenti]